MKILIRNSDNVVFYAQNILILSETDVSGDGWHDTKFNASNSRIEQATVPENWKGGIWSFINGVWSVHDAIAKIAADDLSKLELAARTSAVTMRQARLELLKNGFLDAVNSAVAQMPIAAQIEWEFSGDVHRNNALVVTIQALLGWTDNQMDEFFISAHGL